MESNEKTDSQRRLTNRKNNIPFFHLEYTKQTHHERLCASLNDWLNETLKFALSFEVGIKKQASYEAQNKPVHDEVKTEPVGVRSISYR